MAALAAVAAPAVPRWGGASPSASVDTLLSRGKQYRWQATHSGARGLSLSLPVGIGQRRPQSSGRAVSAFNEDWAMGAFDTGAGDDEVEASASSAQRSGLPPPIASEPVSSEFVRDWNDYGKPPPTRQQKQNRRRRIRHRQKQRTKKMMEETSSARSLTRGISSLRAQRRPAKILEAIRDARNEEERVLNVINYNAALSALVALNSIDEAKQVFLWLSEDVGLDAVAVSTMIKGYGKGGELDEAFQLLERFEETLKNIAPRRLYVVLLNACADAGDTRRARAMMHRIGIQEKFIEKVAGGKTKWGTDPSITYNTNGNERPPLTQGTHRFKVGHLDMKSRLTQFNLLAKAYSNSPTLALEWRLLLEDMRRSGVAPDRVTFNQLLSGAARVGNLEGSVVSSEILSHMKGLAVASQDMTLMPDSISYTCALRAARWSITPVADVLQLLSEIEEGIEVDMGDSDVKRYMLYPDATCIASAIEVLCLVGQPEKAMDYMESWQTKGRAASPRGIVSLMKAYAEQGDLEVVRFLHSRLNRQEMAGKLPGQLIYEANKAIAQARRKVNRRNVAFNIAMAAEAQSQGRRNWW